MTWRRGKESRHFSKRWPGGGERRAVTSLGGEKRCWEGGGACITGGILYSHILYSNKFGYTKKTTFIRRNPWSFSFSNLLARTKDKSTGIEKTRCSSLIINHPNFTHPLEWGLGAKQKSSWRLPRLTTLAAAHTHTHTHTASYRWYGFHTTTQV